MAHFGRNIRVHMLDYSCSGDVEGCSWEEISAQTPRSLARDLGDSLYSVLTIGGCQITISISLAEMGICISRLSCGWEVVCPTLPDPNQSMIVAFGRNGALASRLHPVDALLDYMTTLLFSEVSLSSYVQRLLLSCNPKHLSLESSSHSVKYHYGCPLRSP
jgi:hypothetical protein